MPTEARCPLVWHNPLDLPDIVLITSQDDPIASSNEGSPRESRLDLSEILVVLPEQEDWLGVLDG